MSAPRLTRRQVRRMIRQELDRRTACVGEPVFFGVDWSAGEDLHVALDASLAAAHMAGEIIRAGGGVVRSRLAGHERGPELIAPMRQSGGLAYPADKPFGFNIPSGVARDDGRALRGEAGVAEVHAADLAPSDGAVTRNRNPEIRDDGAVGE